jgi:hypothetical protein
LLLLFFKGSRLLRSSTLLLLPLISILLQEPHSFTKGYSFFSVGLFSYECWINVYIDIEKPLMISLSSLPVHEPIHKLQRPWFHVWVKSLRRAHPLSSIECNTNNKEAKESKHTNQMQQEWDTAESEKRVHRSKTLLILFPVLFDSLYSFFQSLSIVSFVVFP